MLNKLIRNRSLIRKRNQGSAGAAGEDAAQPEKNAKYDAKHDANSAGSSGGGFKSHALTRLGERFARPTVQDFPIQTHEIAGPLQYTAQGVFGWFVLGPMNWEFMTLSERVALWEVQRSRWGQMAEALDTGIRPIRIRRTTRPYAAYEWAARLDQSAVSPLPAVDGAESWDDYLAHGQRRLRSTGLDQRMTAVGIWLGPPPSREAWDDLVCGSLKPGREATALIEQLLEVEELMRRGGLNGERATAGDMAFLMHRSLSMGIPAPSSTGLGGARWRADELGEFVDRRAWLARPFGSAVEVVGETEGTLIRRHVVVMSMGVMPDQTWPDRGQDAWMVASDRLGFPVEWSLNGVLVKGAELEKVAVFEANRAHAIAEHYAEHGITPPPSVARAIQGAVQTRDEVTEGTQRVGPRFLGTVRAAVYGASEDEAVQRARKLMILYKDTLHMPLSRTLDQARVLREFVPGEPRVMKGWTRRFSVGYLAAAMPNIDAEVGTPSGPYLGYSSLSHRAFLSDLHHGPEVLNASGMMTCSAAPGGGKSVLIGSYAYAAARAGEHTVILDPSGPLAALTRLPELKPFAREINLTQAEEGTLSPARMIPVPVRSNYLDASGRVDMREFERAVKMARAERGQLLFDVLRMELSPSLVRTRGVDRRLQDAIRAMEQHPLSGRGDETMWNPRWVLQWLQAHRSDDLCAEIWRELEGASDFPLGGLIIPKHTELIGESGAEDKTLVVVTMPGLEPPPVDVDREYWGAAERHSQPLLHLAAFFASRFIYGRERGERKNCFLDENHLMARWGSGRSFNIRLARDSRKWNAGVLVSSQDPDDHLAIGRLDSLVGGAFVGHLPTDSAARRGCRALGINEEYASVLQTLEPGEFLHRDQMRRVAKVRIDMDWHPSLASLKTTPGHQRAAFTGALEATPFLDPRLFSEHGLGEGVKAA